MSKFPEQIIYLSQPYTVCPIGLDEVSGSILDRTNLGNELFDWFWSECAHSRGNSLVCRQIRCGCLAYYIGTFFMLSLHVRPERKRSVITKVCLMNHIPLSCMRGFRYLPMTYVGVLLIKVN